MGRTVINRFVVFLLLAQFFFSGSSRTEKEAAGHVNVLAGHEDKQPEFTAPISSTKKDITTPITTVPNLVPTTSTSPTLNPNSNPDTVSPAATIPVTTTPATLNYPVSSGASWCVSSPSASQIALQVALDYACGYGGADCAAVQPGGSCYNPNSVRDHASYAFNNYYQKNPVPNSCNFGGTAVITSTNPMTGDIQDIKVPPEGCRSQTLFFNFVGSCTSKGTETCLFPSTSTSSSVLNTTNSSGANVFGSVPVPTNSSPSAAAAKSNSLCFILGVIAFFVKHCV